MRPTVWQWPYEPELDRWNIARVPIPEEMRAWVEVGTKVELMIPDGTVMHGVVENYNRCAWVARVKVPREKNGG